MVKWVKWINGNRVSEFASNSLAQRFRIGSHAEVLYLIGGGEGYRGLAADPDIDRGEGYRGRAPLRGSPPPPPRSFIFLEIDGASELPIPQQILSKSLANP